MTTEPNPERLSPGNFRRFEDQIFTSPIITRQNSFVTFIPERENDNVIRGVRCTCGREIMRRLGVDDFSCDSCSRQYSWLTELTGREIFTRI